MSAGVDVSIQPPYACRRIIIKVLLKLPTVIVRIVLLRYEIPVLLAWNTCM